ncbi:MAG: ribonuclease HII [Desulfobacteraceae bacterium]|nr:MAG: ribonuclease HII [Desulfobacteraceae bacterium]
MHQFETEAYQKGFKYIAGVDEAGRGPLAGPVVSAAVILPERFTHPDINDSKKLTPKKRDQVYDVVLQSALAVGTGICSPREIDRYNILQAALLSMKRAAERLSPCPDFLLIDGKFTIDSDLDQQAVIKGDSKSISIAAASIVAKVTRDRIMAKLHETYPEYNFIGHKGYPTKAHKAAILEFGPCPAHRQTFKGIKEVV